MAGRQSKAAKAAKPVTKRSAKPARRAVAGMVVVTKATLWDDEFSVRERAFLLTEDLRTPDAAGTWLISGEEDIVRPSEVDWEETEALREELAARGEVPAAPTKGAAKKAPAKKTVKGNVGSSRSTPSAPDSASAPLGYEADLWRMADALRGSMDAAEYKHVVLGLIFLKYISDAFEEVHARLDGARGDGADPEDPDEYRAENIFWVPPEARWAHLEAQARQSTIGQIVDEAMSAIERDNTVLKGVLPKDYARPGLDKTRLGQLIDLISNIRVGDAEARSKDVLGRVYEYFLSQFASAEGKKGGEFYTPRAVVRLLVEMLEPFRGRVYDPCCGSSGMFVQSIEFIRAHATGNGNASASSGPGPRRPKADISIYGQELNYTTWRLAQMNLAIRGIEGQIAQGDTFHNDRFPDLKADYVLRILPSTSLTGAASGCAVTNGGSSAIRLPVTPTTRGFSTSFTIWRRQVWPASFSRTVRCRRTS